MPGACLPRVGFWVWGTAACGSSCDVTWFSASCQGLSSTSGLVSVTWFSFSERAPHIRAPKQQTSILSGLCPPSRCLPLTPQDMVAVVKGDSQGGVPCGHRCQSDGDVSRMRQQQYHTRGQCGQTSERSTVQGAVPGVWATGWARRLVNSSGEAAPAGSALGPPGEHAAGLQARGRETSSEVASALGFEG